jgi:dienelactone hydrolase
MTARGAWLVLVLALLSGNAEAQSFKREELRVPAPGAGKQGLQVLFVKPELPGRLPLVIISHGTPLKREDARKATPLLFVPQAIEFARRGWAAAIVMRRGHGDSGGEPVVSAKKACENPDHVAAASAAASDIRATIIHLGKRTDIDGSRMIAVGQSTGGLATVALTAEPPVGLLAAINFAGGAVPTRAGQPCKGLEDRLVDAFKTFGKRSRTPMLWIYSDNDKLFPPSLVAQLNEAFSAGGGRVEYVKAYPFRDDGHSLFARGVQLWTPYVDAFLTRQGLVMLEKPLPVPQPIPTPPRLNANGQRSFEEFLYTPPHRALAVSPSGAIGWYAGARSMEDAKKSALATCTKFAADCRIVVVNDEAVP